MNIWYGCDKVIFRPAWQAEPMDGIDKLDANEYKYLLAIVQFAEAKEVVSIIFRTFV